MYYDAPGNRTLNLLIKSQLRNSNKVYNRLHPNQGRRLTNKLIRIIMSVINISGMLFVLIHKNSFDLLVGEPIFYGSFPLYTINLLH